MELLAILTGTAAFLAVVFWPALRGARALREARDAGVPVRWTSLMGMRFRQVDPVDVFGPLARAARAGVPLREVEVEGHLLAGGDPGVVVDALVLARQRGVEVDFMTLTAVDLAGGDPEALVRDHGTPGGGVDRDAMLAALRTAARNPA